MSTRHTLQDLVSHLMDTFDLSDNVTDIRRAVRAAEWGYRQATTRHRWSMYDDQFTAYFNAPYETGTISIDASGSVTLTDGVFPSWSSLGSIYIGEDRAYRVLERVDDTSCTLENWTGQSLSDSEYVLRQDRVLIPSDVEQVYDVWNETDDWSLRILDPRSFRDYYQPRIYSGADPSVVTFRQVMVSGYVHTEMRVAPASSTEFELDVAYTRRPSRATVLVQKVASVAADTVTLTSPLPFGVSVVGSILRHGDARLSPTADIEFGIQIPSAATFEGIVTSQPSQTELVVPGIADSDRRNVVITDLLDITETMLIPVRMYAEAQMFRIGRGDLRGYRTLMVEADEEMRYAMEKEAPYSVRGAAPNVRVDKLEATPYIVEV